MIFVLKMPGFNVISGLIPSLCISHAQFTTTVFLRLFTQRYIILDLRKIGGVLQIGCDFPLRYTKFENERWPEEGDVLETGGVRITARIRY